MKHVLFIQPEVSGVGGIQKILPNIFSGLVEKKMHVSSLNFYGEGLQDSELNYSVSLNEVESKGLLNKLFKQVSRFFEVVRIVKKIKPNVVIVSTHNTASIVILAKILRLIRVPIIHYVHQSFYNSEGKGSNITLYLQRYFEGFIVVSKGLSDEIKKIIRYEPRNISVAYNGVAISGEYTIRPSVPHFVTASRIELVKGVDVLVELMIRYFNNHPGTVSIYGEGSCRQDFIGRVIKSHLSDRIVFCGPVEDVPSKLLSATAYLSCARSEAFGLSLVEALSCGVPVVCTDVPYGPREVMGLDKVYGTYPEETGYGLLFAGAPPLNSDELLKWLDKNYDNFEKALDGIINKDFSQEMLKSRAEFFSISNQVNQVEEAINKLL